LLVKFIFTREDLSVQVHPGDDYARAHENSSGKTEMWHVLEAGPEARIALGFRERISRERLRDSISGGSILDLLRYIPVKTGDTFYIPAGVVHAIGANITLCEIQQNSDVTYRLYDYGRGREVHVDKALDAALLEPYEGRRDWPVECPYFSTTAIAAAELAGYVHDRDHLLAVLRGEAIVNGETLRAGDVWHAGPGSVEINPSKPVNILKILEA
jgi:mannose-6-phosphate isomerase